MKTVWLKDLLVRLLNDPSSMLSQTIKVINSCVDSKECKLCLFEPDFNDSTFFSISNKGAIIDKNYNDSKIEKIINLAIEIKEIYHQDNIIVAPLYLENVSVFGYVLIKGVLLDEDNFKQAITSLRYYLYNDSLGSIIKSYHDPVFKVRNLYVDYKSASLVHKVIKDVSFDINNKEFTMIFGPSGSGKSTILNVLGGMLSATSGQILFKDKNVASFNEKEKTKYRCNVIGFVFQRFNLISSLTVKENIQIAASLVKDPLTVEEVLEMVDLKGKENDYPNQLSGGEQQKVCIARALVKHSEVLLCDEPTGSLDSKNAMQIMKLLQNLAKEKGIPVVVITHNPNFVVMADHYIRLLNGEIIEDTLQPFALKAENIQN